MTQSGFDRAALRFRLGGCGFSRQGRGHEYPVRGLIQGERTEQDLPAGTVVGEYRIEAKLGEGGFGAVYRAVHDVIGKVAAVKVLHRSYSADAQMVSRFVAEARAVNQIRHKNIIDIFAFGRIDDGRHYFVMELLEGESLEELLHREGRVAVEYAIRILRPVARALGAAHAAGIAHRDLKPDNIFVARDGDGGLLPKLLDFGIAKLLDAQEAAHKTQTGVPIGTPYYMSPEQCRGLEVDERTDVYSFGIVTYRTLTGQLPFDARTSLDIMFKQIHENPRPVSEICPDLPPSFDAPLAAMLAKGAAERPANVEVALDSLAQAAIAAGYPVEAAVIGTSLPAPAGLSDSGQRVRVVSTPADKLGTPTYAQARTLEATPQRITPGISSVKDIAGLERKRSRAPLIVGVVGVGVIGAWLWLSRDVTQTAVTQPPTAAVKSEVKGSASASPLPATPKEEASAQPADPASIELRLTDAPAGGEVFLGDRRLGSASEAVSVPFGRAEVELSLRAPKHKPTVLKITPDRNQSLAAPDMPSQSAPAQPTKRRKEYENPF